MLRTRHISARTAIWKRQWAWAHPLFACVLFASTSAIAGYHSTVVTVTAYNSVKSQTDGRPRIGAWENRLGAHDVAVSPDLVKRGLDNGTTIAIEGYHHDFVVRDKTADGMHNTVDIYMGKDVAKARKFGRKRLRIWWYTSDD